jgi:hypothetical protein
MTNSCSSKSRAPFLQCSASWRREYLPQISALSSITIFPFCSSNTASTIALLRANLALHMPLQGPRLFLCCSMGSSSTWACPSTERSTKFTSVLPLTSSSRRASLLKIGTLRQSDTSFASSLSRPYALTLLLASPSHGSCIVPC